MVSVGPVIVRKRVEATRVAAWAFIVEARQRHRWWPDSHIDPRTDGAVSERWSFGEGDNIESRNASGKIDVFVPGHALGFRWRDGDDEFDTAVLFTLHSQGEAADITITETGFGRFADAGERAADAEQGWIELLDELAAKIVEPDPILDAPDAATAAAALAGAGAVASAAEAATDTQGVEAEPAAIAEGAFDEVVIDADVIDDDVLAGEVIEVDIVETETVDADIVDADLVDAHLAEERDVDATQPLILGEPTGGVVVVVPEEEQELEAEIVEVDGIAWLEEIIDLQAEPQAAELEEHPLEAEAPTQPTATRDADADRIDADGTSAADTNDDGTDADGTDADDTSVTGSESDAEDSAEGQSVEQPKQQAEPASDTGSFPDFDAIIRGDR